MHCSEYFHYCFNFKKSETRSDRHEYLSACYSEYYKRQLATCRTLLEIPHTAV